MVIVVLVTCPNRRTATTIAATVVRRRLAACVNILPGLESIFWWKGKADRAREVLLVMKTTRSRFMVLRAAICRLHPYDVPEVIAVPIVAGHRPYLQWVRKSVAAP